MSERYAILLDGGFVKKKLEEQLGKFPATGDVVGICTDIAAKTRLKDCALFRVYYYDAPPLEGQAKNPMDGSVVNFTGTTAAKQNQALLDSLELEPDFAVRRGSLVQSGWKLGKTALKKLGQGTKTITAKDLVPDIKQKGVDIRIGLDIASIAVKRIVAVLVLVTGDSDFVPAMKLARKEGLKVYLATLGHGVRRELKVHADFVL